MARTSKSFFGIAVAIVFFVLILSAVIFVLKGKNDSANGQKKIVLASGVTITVSPRSFFDFRNSVYYVSWNEVKVKNGRIDRTVGLILKGEPLDSKFRIKVGEFEKFDLHIQKKEGELTEDEALLALQRAGLLERVKK
ncbi:hypothetical protein [Flavobacterium aurantiibacter]|uniref:Uncharacterized protein n=1 Tax=Flavobacterium aurantiibacter TaxID=2023067 RepID=A0A255ZXX0_9FLAO|nr:hypothetical protein [Flavobacterium aurantiibacter]OYQ46338.1 hypothetical protein CHX27_04640 [Flavobacterium aurantiibacter]